MEKGTEGVDGGPGPVQPAEPTPSASTSSVTRARTEPQASDVFPLLVEDDIASRHGNLYSSYHNIGMSAIHFSRPILNGTGWLDRTARVEGSKLPPVQMANQRRKE